MFRCISIKVYTKQKPYMLDYQGCMHFKGGNSHSEIERCTSDNDSDIYRGELWLCWAARDIWLTVRDIYYWRSNDIWLCFYHWLRFLLWKLLSHAQWAINVSIVLQVKQDLYQEKNMTDGLIIKQIWNNI